jgi:hypothetical protein
VTQWRKYIDTWRSDERLFISVPFTWLLSEAKTLADRHHGLFPGKVIAGGPAVKLCGAPWADETPETCAIDVLALHNPDATFTTRGCPNQCPFCAVPKIEGEFRELSRWRRAPIVCDNNLLASSRHHFEAVIDSLLDLPGVDFNQGLDARRFTAWHADQIARLRRCKVRFAFDHAAMESKVADAIAVGRKAGLRDFGVYVLIGWRDSPAEAQYRLETIRSWGVWPNPMRYQPLDAERKNMYVAPGWTEAELRRMQRYYSRLAWLEHIPYADYQGSSAGRD